jgi:hypothetical protein
MSKERVKFVLASLVLAFFGTGAAQAQNCQGNFKIAGVPMVSGMVYRSWDIFPNVAPATALSNLHRTVAAEGFSGVRLDKASGTVSAIQETTGSGRPQTLRVTARKAGNATRVEVVFEVQPGQIAPEGSTRAGICRVIAGARG